MNKVELNNQLRIDTLDLFQEKRDYLIKKIRNKESSNLRWFQIIGEHGHGKTHFIHDLENFFLKNPAMPIKYIKTQFISNDMGESYLDPIYSYLIQNLKVYFPNEKNEIIENLQKITKNEDLIILWENINYPNAQQLDLLNSIILAKIPNITLITTQATKTHHLFIQANPNETIILDPLSKKELHYIVEHTFNHMLDTSDENDLVEHLYISKVTSISHLKRQLQTYINQNKLGTQPDNEGKWFFRSMNQDFTSNETNNYIFQYIFKNVQQGILIVNESLEIITPYSSYCEKLFAKDHLANSSFLDLLFSQTDIDSTQLENVSTILTESFQTGIINFEINRDKFPKTITKHMQPNDINLELDWIPLANENSLLEYMMVFVRDITHITQVLNKATNIGQELNLIDQILNSSSQSIEIFFQSSREYLHDIRNILVRFHRSQLIDAPNKIAILRSIYTIKGYAQGLNFEHLAHMAHELENIILGWEKPTQYNEILRKLTEFQNQIRQFKKTYDENIKKFQRNFPLHSQLSSSSAIRELGNQIKKVIDSEQESIAANFDQNHQVIHGPENKVLKQIVQLIDKSQKRTLRSILEEMVLPLTKLSQDLQIPAPRLAILDHSDGIPIEYVDLIKENLQHCFYNSLGHGIEDGQTRIAKGLKENGTITVKVEQSHQKNVRGLEIQIQDDGVGLALGRIREKLEKIGLNVDKMNDEQISEEIFKSGLSTSAKVSPVTGRGLGLAAVKSSLEKLGGEVHLQFLDVQQEGFRPFSIHMFIPIIEKKALS